MTSGMPTTLQSDICIIGGGISTAMLAQKLSELRPGKSITVVEAGKRISNLENRFGNRQRNLQYGENAWPGDFIPDQVAEGMISRTMAVGGSAAALGRNMQSVFIRGSAAEVALRTVRRLAHRVG